MRGTLVCRLDVAAVLTATRGTTSGLHGGRLGGGNGRMAGGLAERSQGLGLKPPMPVLTLIEQASHLGAFPELAALDPDEPEGNLQRHPDFQHSHPL